MKLTRPIRTVPACLLAAVLLALGATTVAKAAAPALQGQIVLRPLTPQEVKTYTLTGVQTASGLNAVAIGQPAYLDALVNINYTNTDITNVVWTLAAQPIGSTAALADSPLGTNVPTYNPVDRPRFKVAGRAMLKPDMVGQYSVTVSIATVANGTTNLTQKITGATYLGANTCSLCHGGNNFLHLEDMATPWSQTLHAHAFTDAIDGKSTDHFSQNCIKCHSVGFDANTNSANGGFDDVAAQTGWVFPTVFTNGNWAAMPAALKNVANVQCENCHGPGSEHAYAFGNTNVFNWPRLAKTVASGNCAQCHDSLSHHSKTAEWNNSRHATMGSHTSAACSRCHTAQGFANYLDGKPAVATPYEVHSCASCHDPHDATNPHQLRAGHTTILNEGTVVEHAGAGGFCMNCHQSRTGSITNSLVNYPIGKPTYPGGSSSFGPHDNPAADMLLGVNGETYGKYIPSAAHRTAITNTCVSCHMQTLASTDPGFTKAGGHTMKLSYEVVTGGVTNTAHLVEACVKCHGEIESFNMVKSDYNGDGVIEGVQTEVQKLLNQLSTLLPGPAYVADGNYVADGLVKTRMNTRTNMQQKFLKADWNWRFVNNDLSKGVHNAPYAVGLLKASIADLTDDADHDGLSDKWEIATFGSILSSDANGDSDHDGVSNALELAAGTNALLADSDGDGVNDLAELQAGSDPLNPNDQPGFVVKIYGAAEVEFASEIGKKYQVQKVSDITGTWINEGSVTNGTGNNISMTTSTRSGGAQNYFRVLLVP